MEECVLFSAFLPNSQLLKYILSENRPFAATGGPILPDAPCPAHQEEAPLMQDDYEHPDFPALQSRSHLSDQ